MIILGIETSCDETAVAIVNHQGITIEHKVWSQNKQKKIFGGIIPEIAARAHLIRLPKIINNIIKSSNISINNLTAVAASAGPGLMGGLFVGVMLGRALASSLNKPFLTINHLRAHALIPRINSILKLPYLLLLTSGGHCQLVLVNNTNKNFKLIGTTVDDTAGEIFDKIARYLKIVPPNGANIERIAKKGDQDKFKFSNNFSKKANQTNFSFSGLKTSTIRNIDATQKINNQICQDIAASLQKTICDIFEKTTENAIKHLKNKSIYINNLVISGGVAANKRLINRLNKIGEKYNLQLNTPPKELCTDNGVMIAWSGIEKLKLLPFLKNINSNPRSRWPLEEE